MVRLWTGHEYPGVPSFYHIPDGGNPQGIYGSEYRISLLKLPLAFAVIEVDPRWSLADYPSHRLQVVHNSSHHDHHRLGSLKLLHFLRALSVHLFLVILADVRRIEAFNDRGYPQYRLDYLIFHNVNPFSAAS